MRYLILALLLFTSCSSMLEEDPAISVKELKASALELDNKEVIIEGILSFVKNRERLYVDSKSYELESAGSWVRLSPAIALSELDSDPYGPLSEYNAKKVRVRGIFRKSRDKSEIGRIVSIDKIAKFPLRLFDEEEHDLID